MNETSAVLGLTPPALPPLTLAEGDAERDLALPADHPRWQRDVVSISARARAALAALAPLAVRVLTYWDHRVREIAFGQRRLAVDPAGCYRLR